MNGEDKVGLFINSYGSKSTKKTYKAGMKKYITFLDITPSEALSDKRNHREDIIRYAQALAQEGRTPKSYRLYMNVVRSFYKFFEININGGTWDIVNRQVKGKKARTMDRPPTTEELKRIITHSELLTKALVSVAVSSGMRIGEILSLLPSDIDFDYKPTKINVRGEITKSGEPRITFISDEATQLLKEWIEIGREDYLDKACKHKTLKVKIEGKDKYRALPNKDRNDPRLFPTSQASTRLRLIRILKKLGIDDRDSTTDRYVLHYHSFRKYFRTKLGSEIPIDIVEALMGHEGYLTTYRSYPIEELAKHYSKAKHVFNILGESTHREELEQQRKAIDDLREEMKEEKKLMNTYFVLQEKLFWVRHEQETPNSDKHYEELEDKAGLIILSLNEIEHKLGFDRKNVEKRFKRQIEEVD